MTLAQGADFALNPQLQVASLADRFASFGRIQIGEFLDSASADRLLVDLEASDRWRHLINSQERFYEIPGADWDALPEAERHRVARAVDEAAAFDFQYQYDTIRVPDDVEERARSNTLLDRFAQFLSSGPVLDAMMRITGADDLVYADCQATRYRSGDFLTPHNDEVEGMHRRFAYVLSLTRDWLPRWGGLLHFVDPTGGVEETITPRFNTLSLFAVGQSHYVSQVASYAPVPRISATGWLRTRPPG
jgi:Rps23 Pro-64 3,4-dihydroxylase Tpa1-like proline 4-hydroxylase